MTRTFFSPSSHLRRKLCPGSLALESQLLPVDSDDSIEGRWLHQAIWDGGFHDALLSAEQFATVDKAHELMTKFFDSVGCGYLAAQYEIETPLTLIDGTIIFCHLDAHIAFGTPVQGVVCVDFKFGRAPVESAEANLQIQDYLCACAERYPSATDFYGAIIQPRISDQVQPVHYTRDDIRAAMLRIEADYAACTAPDAKRIPSHAACRWCLGLLHGTCDEARSLALSVTSATSVPSHADARAKLASMSPATRTALFDAFFLADKLRNVFTSAAKVILETDPEFVPEYKLCPGGQRETVADIPRLTARLMKLGIQREHIENNLTISKKTIESLLRSTGLKGKALEDAMTQTLEGIVDKTPVSPSFERRC